jgi:hypothetical protein
MDILSLQLKLKRDFLRVGLEVGYVFELGSMFNEIAYEFCMRPVYKNLEVQVWTSSRLGNSRILIARQKL